MKLLIVSIFLLLFSTTTVQAQVGPSPSPTATSSGQVQGVTSDPFATEYSDLATGSATASISATPRPTPRLVKTSTAKTPVSGAVENTIILLVSGTLLILFGLRYSKNN